MGRSQFNFGRAVQISLSLVGVLWVVMAMEMVSGMSLLRFGIRPRTMAGLPGIVFGPLLHGNLRHLVANSVPLVVLLALLWSNRAYHAGRTLALIWGASGLGIWLIGRGDAIHIGASGVVFGLVAFLVVAGFRIRSWKPAVVALLVLLVYGGIFYGVLPQGGTVSWEGHLCGAIVGAWTGWGAGGA